jgi:Na+/H+ antiporter NhaA
MVLSRFFMLHVMFRTKKKFNELMISFLKFLGLSMVSWRKNEWIVIIITRMQFSVISNMNFCHFEHVQHWQVLCILLWTCVLKCAMNWHNVVTNLRPMHKIELWCSNLL